MKTSARVHHVSPNIRFAIVPCEKLNYTQYVDSVRLQKKPKTVPSAIALQVTAVRRGAAKCFQEEVGLPEH
jgi:hypothetical protein